ncbi:MAG: hypothetical protein RLZ12_644 [Bacillota bacterium]|jgi:hypothetical protein
MYHHYLATKQNPIIFIKAVQQTTPQKEKHIATLLDPRIQALVFASYYPEKI